MIRPLKYIALSILLLILGITLLIAVLLASERAGRWVLQQVPGLQVEQFSGRLGGTWQAARLHWQQGDLQIELRQLVFEWQPACLLGFQLCLKQVAVDEVALSLPTATDEPASDEPLSLPDIHLPLSASLESVRLGRLQIGETEQLRDLLLQAQWDHQGLTIQRLQLQRDDLNLDDLSGHLQPFGQWPLQLALQAELKLAPGQQPWSLKANLEGEAAQQLLLDLHSQGYLQARLQARVEALAEHLPAELQLEVHDFLADASLPAELQLKHLDLKAKGDLQQGYALEADGRFPGERQAIVLGLQGHLDADGADIGQLFLRPSEQAERHLLLSGRVDWKNALDAQATLAWRDFPWQRLYPMQQEPPVALKRLDAKLSYGAEQYQGQLSAELQGPAGDFNLSTGLQGNQQQLTLSELLLQAGQGRLQGQASLAFAGPLQWDTELRLSQLDPSYWLAELPGRLEGRLSSQGRLLEQGSHMQAEADIHGTLRRQPARLSLKASAEGSRWALPELDLRLGDNRLQGRGHVDQRLDAELNLAFSQLAQLWPGLRGRLDGKLQLAGNLQAPQGNLQVNAQGVAFEETRLRQMQLAASLDSAQRGQLQVQASGLEQGEQAIGELTLKGSGTLQQHALNLDLQGPLLELSTRLSGSLNDRQDWRGQVAQLQVASHDQQWQLQQPLAVQRQANGRLTLAAHCLVSAGASLCAEDTQRLVPDLHLRYRLRDFPLDSLKPWLPEALTWQGMLNARVALDMPAAGPSGEIQVEAGPGVLQLKEQDQTLAFPYQTLRLASQLKPSLIDSQLTFSGANLGRLQAQVAFDPRSRQQNLSGSFAIEAVQLAVARPFVPQVEVLAGELNGQGRIAGTLQQPQVNGQLRLDNGQISGGELPTDFQDLRLVADIQGDRVMLDGNWRSQEQGRGNLQGLIGWGSSLAMDINLSASRLPVTVAPYAELEVEPDLQISLVDNQLAVRGQVGVPRGKITLRELPASTVKVSEDAQVMGEQRSDEQGMAIAMDVNVEVGQDKLTFSGFGLNAELLGHLKIGNDLDTRGELQLAKGRYRAYGQRLTLRRARLLFNGPLEQPFLDIEAIREVDDVTAGLRITGNADEPQTEVFSEPTMSQEQALSYLVLGRPLGSGGDDNMLAQAALALGMAGGTPLAGELAKSLGIQEFQLDTEGSGNSTSVVASGRITDRLSLRYGVGVFEPVNTIGLRYELTRKLYLEAVSGLVSSLDLFYRRDF